MATACDVRCCMIKCEFVCAQLQHYRKVRHQTPALCCTDPSQTHGLQHRSGTGTGRKHCLDLLGLMRKKVFVIWFVFSNTAEKPAAGGRTPRIHTGILVCHYLVRDQSHFVFLGFFFNVWQMVKLSLKAATLQCHSCLQFHRNAAIIQIYVSKNLNMVKNIFCQSFQKVKLLLHIRYTQSEIFPALIYQF